MRNDWPGYIVDMVYGLAVAGMIDIRHYGLAAGLAMFGVLRAIQAREHAD